LGDSVAERQKRSRLSKDARVARYFLHLRNGSDEFIDPEGADLADIEALKKMVMRSVRDLLAGDIRNGVVDLRCRVDAEDGNGVIVYTLPFEHAFSIIPGTA